MSDNQSAPGIVVPARALPVPDFLSPQARGFLAAQPTPPAYPAIEDKAAWRRHVEMVEQHVTPMLEAIGGMVQADTEERVVDGARVFDITPAGLDGSQRGVVLDMHGGALILCGGPLCRLMGLGLAAKVGRRVWTVDYRMPPDHPYPAALDDCLAAYRALLRERAPQEIVVNGGSAGGNLAAALMLRARDEGLPLPAALVLNTPEIDLTESGDSFHTNNGVDPGLRSLMPVNLLYANGHDLRHPYLSPLFGDLAGLPPTLLTTGTRDLYLSNTVRMHRALREAGVPAELHVTEAGPHTGFPGAPEGEQIAREIRRFVDAALDRRREG